MFQFIIFRNVFVNFVLYLIYSNEFTLEFRVSNTVKSEIEYS